ncbi:MAB_1171c family putative transporter [Amycolatopsis anabasis]|uniref:MAB_1171c family putative transporter n=1 Tax=Amycolatopsis anabasis TaxID=1840409 RepID=UPI00131D4C08|nr:MAB_1171c family putative transporter [Amycolatopsis anabasis]
MLEVLRNLGLHVQAIAIVSMWVVTLVRAPVVVRTPAQRGLWVAVAMSAGAVTIHHPAVVNALFGLVGQTHYVPLAGNLFGILSAFAVMDFVTTAAGIRRRVWLLFGGAGAVITAMVILDLVAPEHLLHRIPLVGYPSPSPAYWLVAAATHIGVNAACVVVCWRYSRRGDTLVLRIALRLFGVGAGLFGAYWLGNAIVLFTRFAGIPAAAPLIVGCAGLLYATATAIPLVFVLTGRARDLRSFWQLRPIWSELTDAVPQVALTRPSSRARALVLSTRALRLSLYRIVVEIRDAILVLRDYVEPRQLADIQRAVAGDAGEPDQEPLITAHWLRLAREAKLNGTPAQPHPLNVASLGGANVTTEIEFLRKVAKVYRNAPTAGA